MIAMLVSVEIADAQMTTHPASAQLTEIFPGLPSRERLNRTIGDARLILQSAESHLAHMAIPHVLSLHHRTMGAALQLLREDGRTVTAPRTVVADSGERETQLVQVDPFDIQLSEVHDALKRASGLTELFQDVEVKVVGFLRQLRNRLTHQGVTAGHSLKTQWAALGSDGQALWEQIARRAFPLVKARDQLVLEAPELFVALAVCKRLEDDAEQAVINALSPSALATIVVYDYAARHPHRTADATRLSRRLQGFREREYARFSSVETEDLLDAEERWRSEQG
jgi:hypothetical protein